MDKRVSIVKCGSYAEAARGVHESLAMLGGMAACVKKGDRVVIKPNYVSRKNPAEAATTHPQILRAVIAEAQACGGIVTVAESPGGPYNKSALKVVYDGCGAYDAIAGTEAELNFDTEFEEVEFPEGHTLKKFPIIKPILDADVIISLAKLKTHAMTSYTGAVKNLYGTIPGTYKAELHFRLNDRRAFCSMLVDLCECVKPTLSIMDAVWGMEGNGPTAGESRHIGLVMASANAHALDLAACKLIDYRPDEVDTVKFAEERGLIPKTADELEILGEKIEPLVMKDFKKPESHFDLLHILPVPTAVRAWITDRLSARPVPGFDMCIGCGECARCCPPGAIDMKDKHPVIRRDACIKCFCCQELCPKKAIKIKRGLLNRAMLKILK